MEKGMNEITPKKADAVRKLAAKLAHESPTLADLSEEQLNKIAKAVIVDNLKDDLKRRADIARVDYSHEKKTFIAHAGRTKSEHTRKAYQKALDRLEAWAAKKGIDVLEMRFRDADDFCYSLSAEGRSTASVRLDVAAASSFFSYLERRYDHIRNPFRGTKARPVKKEKMKIEIPNAHEVDAIIKTLSGPYRAAIVVMAFRGLRVGALPSLSIRGDRFTAHSKGKDISGTMPPEAMRAIRRAKLDKSAPFADLSADKISDHFKYVVGKLFRAGKIGAWYSVHDLRHFFAVNEYQKDKDIYRLKEILFHSGIQITELYLKSLTLE